MSDEHSLGLTDPRIIQILQQSKEGRAKLKAWSEREADADKPMPIPCNQPQKSMLTAVIFSLVIAALLTLLMIGVIEVLRWFF
jgi:hypothetical protein